MTQTIKKNIVQTERVKNRHKTPTVIKKKLPTIIAPIMRTTVPLSANYGENVSKIIQPRSTTAKR